MDSTRFSSAVASVIVALAVCAVPSAALVCKKVEIPSVISPKDSAGNVTWGPGFSVFFYVQHPTHLNAPYEAVHLTLPIGTEFPPHRHNAAWEMLFVLKGKMEYNFMGVNDAQPTGPKMVLPGELTHTPIHAIHALKSVGDEDLELLVMSPKIAPMEFFLDGFPADHHAEGVIPPVNEWEKECPVGFRISKEEL